MADFDWKRVSELKEAANKSYGSGSFDQAKGLYTEAIELARKFPKDSLTDSRNRELALLYSNRSQCNLRLQRYRDCIQDATFSVELFSDNAKAYYRRGVARKEIGDYESALQDLNKAASYSEDKRSIAKEIVMLKQLLGTQCEIASSPQALVDELRKSRNMEEKRKMVILDSLASIFSSQKQKREVLNNLKVVEILLHLARDVIESPRCRASAFQTLRKIITTGDCSSQRTLFNCLSEAPMILEEYSIVSKDAFQNSSKELSFLKQSFRALLFSVAVLPEDIKARSSMQYFLLGYLESLCSVSVFDRITYLEMLDLLNDIGIYLLQKSDLDERGNSKAVIGREIQSKLIEHVLCSKLIDDPEIKKSMITTLVFCSGKLQFDGNLKGTTKNSDEDVVKPAVDDNFLNSCRTIVEKRLFNSNKAEMGQALKATSIILQASPHAGHTLVTSEKWLPLIAEIAFSHLHPFREAALEIMALASSDTLVRNAISDGGLGEHFLELISSSDENVKSHAGLALAKLSLKDQKIFERCLDEHNIVEEMLIIAGNSSPGCVSKSCVIAIEALSYLTLHIRAKKSLLEQENGKLLQFSFLFFDFRETFFGILQILCNVCTSVEDLKNEHQAEIEQLKKLASQGLDTNKEQEVIKSNAGSLKAIFKLRKGIIDLGAVKEITIRLKKESIQKLSKHALSCLSKTLLFLSHEKQGEHYVRGKMVQQGVLSILLALFQSEENTCKLNSATALARIAIVVNPALYSTGVIEGLIQPLLFLLKECSNELQEFEGLLALTNLASYSEAMRSLLYKSGAWYAFQMCLSSENLRIQTAALQALSNMIGCEEVLEKLKVSGDNDLQIFLAFCKSDDVTAVSAASGALAMATYDPDIAKCVEALHAREIMNVLKRSSLADIVKRANAVLENMDAVCTRF